MCPLAPDMEARVRERAPRSASEDARKLTAQMVHELMHATDGLALRSRSRAYFADMRGGRRAWTDVDIAELVSQAPRALRPVLHLLGRLCGLQMRPVSVPARPIGAAVSGLAARLAMWLGQYAEAIEDGDLKTAERLMLLGGLDSLSDHLAESERALTEKRGA